MASEEAVNKHNLTPLARLVDYTVVGVDPSIMGIGPAPAIKQLLEKQGLSLDQIDLIEVSSEKSTIVGSDLVMGIHLGTYLM